MQTTQSENIAESVEIMDTLETEPKTRGKAGKKMKSIKDMAKDIDFTSGSENEKTPRRRSQKVAKTKRPAGTGKRGFYRILDGSRARHCGIPTQF